MLHCNGQCQFMKKLVQHEKKEQQNSENKSAGKSETNLSSKSFFTTAPAGQFRVTKRFYTIFNEKEVTGIPSSLFHPPGII